VSRLEGYKNLLLNGALAVLVVLSTYLSAQVWFPSDQIQPPGFSEAQVETPPPDLNRGMPEIYRPEHLIITRGDGQTALLTSGSSSYLEVWRWTQFVLSYAHPALPGGVNNATPTRAEDASSITLILPIVMRVSDWAERWGWQSAGLPFSLLGVDRVIIQLGSEAGIYLQDVNGKRHGLSLLFDSERIELADMIDRMDSYLFYPDRKLDLKDQYVTIHPGLLVQDVALVSRARVQVRKPVDSTERLRFFPDISVVRQIEERDARIFTDGQRLLRLTNSGLLEYRTADVPGVAPDFPRALQSAREWIGSHGGWPTDLVLGWFAQELGKARLQFDYRLSGPIPVETADGAIRIDMNADRVIQFRRYPDIVEITTDQWQLSVIKPEDAVRIAAQEISLFLFESVRQVHMAYLLREGRDSDPTDWVLEPCWVIKVGPAKIYVPAELGLDKRVLTIRR